MCGCCGVRKGEEEMSGKCVGVPFSVAFEDAVNEVTKKKKKERDKGFREGWVLAHKEFLEKIEYWINYYKKNELYPAFGLNSRVEELEQIKKGLLGRLKEKDKVGK